MVWVIFEFFVFGWYVAVNPKETEEAAVSRQAKKNEQECEANQSKSHHGPGSIQWTLEYAPKDY